MAVLKDDKIIAPKGLAGVVADDSSISKVNPETNSLMYRGYAAPDLVEKRSFTDVAYLLVNGELPTQAEYDAFVADEKSNRDLPEEILAAIKSFPKTAHPMDSLRTAVSMLGLFDERTWSSDKETNIEKFNRVFACIPTAIAAIYRSRKGLDLIKPDKSLEFEANFFNMCFGEVPPKEILEAFDASMILYAEHSFNASTFTTRVITSTQADMYGAITGGIAALKGPLHGGANEMVMHMLIEIGSPDKAKAWLMDALENKKKVMGFGHRVYNNGDSRVPTMKEALKDVAKFKNDTQWIKICDVLEMTMIEEKGIYPNLDFPAGPTYYLMGFDIDFFTPLFVMARVSGWSANIIEQAENNRIIRPLANYTGPKQRPVPETRS